MKKLGSKKPQKPIPRPLVSALDRLGTQWDPMWKQALVGSLQRKERCQWWAAVPSNPFLTIPSRRSEENSMGWLLQGAGPCLRVFLGPQQGIGMWTTLALEERCFKRQLKINKGKENESWCLSYQYEIGFGHYFLSSLPNVAVFVGCAWKLESCFWLFVGAEEIKLGESSILICSLDLSLL